jgi:hypothetical protein
MMADAHYFFYHTACFEDPTIPDDVFSQICFNEDNDILRSWPHKAAVYPVTICWEPSQDQTPSDDPWDTFSFRSIYPPEAQRVEESTPEPPAATANHRRGISDVIARSEREQQHERERPAARRAGRRVGASEL